jgi:predicted  nucleic acid-binding Zn-ribbon protein
LAVNKLIIDKDSIISDFRLIEKTLFDTAELQKEQSALASELTITAELIQKCVAENARIALDQTEYQKRYDSLVERFETTKSRLSEAENQIFEKRSRSEIFRKFITDLEKQDSLISEFDSELWCSLVDFATVKTNGEIEFTFKNGTTI